ncbi:hypothetical protein AB833_16970 [Chromatiales bacterium (ex Bugula neritina AB1)]|nr:hypothetical protein AB833_16970 [Chromatiales bacterium (ex Bugula neritina AB1)]
MQGTRQYDEVNHGVNKMKLIRYKTYGLVALLLLICFITPVHSESIFEVTLLQHQQLQQQDYDYRTTLMLGNRTEHLLLNNSPVFLGAMVTDDSGRSLDSAPGGKIAFAGIVEDMPGSWVRITIENESVNGVINTGKERYFIDSNKGQVPNPSQIRHMLHLASAVDTIVYPPKIKPDESGRRIQEVVEIDINSGLTPKPGVITRVARIAIVIDNLYDEAHAGRGLNKAISTINSVDGLYRENFGLALKVEHVVMITDNTTLGLANFSLEENLAHFRDYRIGAVQLEADLGMVHLFTGVITDDDSVGLAYIDAACRIDGYDVSISLPFQFPVLLTAHEMGHTLGALHDDETELCKDNTDQLMYSHISATTTDNFSSCSAEKISRKLELSRCHLDAIDAALTLTQNDDQTISAVVTNTDQFRALPAALVKLELKNTSIAAAPAICEIESSTTLTCPVPRVAPEESYSLIFELQPEGNEEKNILATFDAIGFIDPQAINNSAEFLIAATDLTPTGTLVIANNDGSGSDTVTGNANSGGASSSASGGGGQFSELKLLELLFLLLITVALKNMTPCTVRYCT